MENKFNWDNTQSKDIIIIREMLYEHPTNVLKKYSQDKLKEILINFYFHFDRKNLNFWKIILGIEDNEFRRKTENSFRRDCKIWNY